MPIEFDGPTLIRNVTMQVRLKRWTQVRVRFWLMVQLLRFAVWVGGMGIEIVEDEE